MVTAKLNPSLKIHLCHLWQESLSNLTVYQKGFNGIAYRRILYFCIEADLPGYIEISILVHIDMADPAGVSKYRNFRIFLDKLDKLV